MTDRSLPIAHEESGEGIPVVLIHPVPLQRASQVRVVAEPARIKGARQRSQERRPVAPPFGVGRLRNGSGVISVILRALPGTQAERANRGILKLRESTKFAKNIEPARPTTGAVFMPLPCSVAGGRTKKTVGIR